MGFKLPEELEELKSYPSWVCYALKEKGGKTTKPPVDPHTGKPTNESFSYEDAVSGIGKSIPGGGKIAGIGFRLTAETPYTVVDLDHCLDANGKPTEEGRGIVDTLATYTEVSPSGNGLHLWVKGKKPGTDSKRHGSNGTAYEMYDRDRYMTITGKPFETRKPIRENVEGIRKVYFQYIAKDNPVESDFHTPVAMEEFTDEEVLTRALIDQDFVTLWNDKAPEDRSKNDFALCKILAEASQGNAEQIDRIMRTSEQAREKWDSMRGKETWLQYTVRNAIAEWRKEKERDEKPQRNFPPILTLSQALIQSHPLKPELIEGILRQSHKMIISAPSKAGKSFALIELCIALATGGKWIGFKCKQSTVLYINLEIDENSCIQRYNSILCAEFIDETEYQDRIKLWNLRGYGVSINDLKEAIIDGAKQCGAGAIMIDPIYKTLNGDENSNSDMAKFAGCFDEIARETNASVIYAHHFAKGDASNKSMIDRASGAGVFARDPDAIITFTPLAPAGSYRVEFTLREFKTPDPINVKFRYPVHVVDETGELKNAKPLSPQEMRRLETRDRWDELISASMADLEPDSDGWVKQADLVNKIKTVENCSPKTIRDHLAESGLLESEKRGSNVWLRRKISPQEDEAF